MTAEAIPWAIVIAIALVVPFWKLLPRYGFSKWYAVFAVFPAIAVVFLWLIAFKDESEG